MKVYPSDVKDWNAEAAKSRVEPTHPYDLESADNEFDKVLLLVVFPLRLVLRFVFDLLL